MAVNVSTTTRVCLYCKINTETDATKEFHNIYDEVGQELQLPTLVEKFFHIVVKNKADKLLCDDCVNRLIELYDLEEHGKEERARADDLIAPETTENLTDQTTDKSEINLNKENLATNNETEIILPKSALDCRSLEGITEKSANVKATKTESFQYSKYENINDVEFLIETVQSSTCAKYIGDSSYEESSEENMISEEALDVSQELNNITISITEESINEYESLNDEFIQFDDEDNTENLNANIIGTEISAHEFAVLNANEDQAVAEYETDGNSTYSKENNLFEEQFIVEEISEQEEEDNFSQNKANYFVLEEIHGVNLQKSSDEKELLSNVQDTVENNLKTVIVLDSDKKLLKSNENYVSGEKVDERQTIENDEDVDDTFAIEDYLIEEINCSEEYDPVDINEYLDKVILTKFQDLELDWAVECALCSEEFFKFQELLQHPCVTDFEENQKFFCLFKDCQKNVHSLPTLARHLILQHYDNLKSTSIYSKCPDCQKMFSTIIDLNKHSCCRNIKRRAGLPNYCQNCDMDFQSLKRFVFHMQFHLTNHRPKICLLCGDSFKTSNDFFEHTQYMHNPDADMACIQCDRFFKEKEVFENHMELHEDSKYQFACDYCPKKYTNKVGLTLHMNVYHNNKSKVIKCDYCEKEFANNSSYRNHIKSHADDVQVESFVCSSCGLISNSSDFIQEHIESDTDSSCFAALVEEKILSFGYSCENCSVDFHTLKDLKKHRLSKNHSDELFHCSVCRKTFKTLRHMRNHSVNHKDFEKCQEAFPITRYFVCNIGDCEEFYPIWTTLYYHKKRPHKTKNSSAEQNEFKCQFCQQMCSSKMSLAVHVARTHNNSNAVCPHCKRSHKTEELLQEHINKFHKVVRCDICLKDFKNRRNLESHNRSIHLSIKRYFCKYCDKGYFHKSEKDSHETKTHPEFSYKCELCNFITNYSKSLEIHMDKHNNRLKFKCTICGKHFGRNQLLKVHLKRHENKKEYICRNYLTEKGCDASFYTFNTMKNHIQTKHGKTKHQKLTNKRSKPSKQHLTVETIDDYSYELLDSDEDNVAAKRFRTTTNNDQIYLEDEEGIIELSLENELLSDDQKSDEDDDYILEGEG